MIESKVKDLTGELDTVFSGIRDAVGPPTGLPTAGILMVVERLDAIAFYLDRIGSALQELVDKRK